MTDTRAVHKGLESWSTPRETVSHQPLGGQDGGRYFDAHGGSKEEEYHNSSSTLVSQILLQLSGEEHVLQPYLENMFIRAAVKAIQNGFARLDFGMWDGDPTLDTSRKVDNALSELLARPNREMTGRDLFTVHANSMKLDGESYWFLANSRGNPVGSSKLTGVLTSKISQIIPVRGANVTVNTDDNGWPSTYAYQISGTSKGKSPEFPWGSVVAFRDYDPYDAMRGVGDVQCAVRAIDLQHQVLRYMDATLRNGGGPGGFIIFKEAVNPAELERRQAEADDNNSTEDRRRLKILDRDAKYVPNNMSPSDMEYTTLWDRMIDAILTCIGVPGPVVGRYTEATYNNVSTAYRQMWTGPNGILSLSAHTADIIQNKLRPRMVRVYPKMANLVAHFDPSQIDELQESQHESIKLSSDVAAKGIGVSLNDALMLTGANVDPVDGGDLKLVKGGQTDVESGKEFGTAPQGRPEAGGQNSAFTQDQIERALVIKRNGNGKV